MMCGAEPEIGMCSRATCERPLRDAVALDPGAVGLLGVEREVFSFTSLYC